MIKKKKILQVGYSSFAKAGSQTVIMNIARGVYKDFNIDVLLFSNEPGYYDEEFQSYGTIYRLNCSVKGFGKVKKLIHFVIRPFKQYFYAKKLIKTNQYDIVHIHNGLEGGPIFLAAKAAKVKHIIAHSHNTASGEKRSFFSRIYRAINKHIIHLYATVKIGVSQDANRYLYGDDENFIINNPVDLDNFINVERKPRGEEIVLTNVGRYCYQKNQGFILDIFNALIKDGHSARLNLVGFGEDEKKLQSKIEELCLTDYVQMFPGNGDVDIPAILGDTDVFIFPSKFEGLGIVMIEAQAAGCLCLASNVVPKETDLGLSEYLDLSEDIVVWEKKIINMVKKSDEYRLNEELLNSYYAPKIQEQFRLLYHSLASSKKEIEKCF